MSLDIIPTEILLQITRHLRQRDLLSLSRTSRFYNNLSEPIIYHSINEGHLLNPETAALVARKLVNNKRLASAVQTLGIGFAPNRPDLDIDFHVSQILKSCPNITCLEIYPNPCETLQPMVLSTDHLSLKRLIMDIYNPFTLPNIRRSTLLCQQNSITELVIHYSYGREQVQALQYTDLPNLRSLSATGETIHSLKVGRPIENVNCVALGPPVEPKGALRVLEWLGDSPGSVPIRRLRIDIARFGEMVTIDDDTVENLGAGVSEVEVLEIAVMALNADMV